jgi:four helix bundle protein
MVLPHRQVGVWRRAYDLAMDVLEILESPALAKQFWLRDQLVRSVFSIQANIAEGNGRSTAVDYASFLDRARASAFETDTWLLVAADRGWIARSKQSQLENELDGISATLYKMARTLRAKGTLDSRPVN